MTMLKPAKKQATKTIKSPGAQGAATNGNVQGPMSQQLPAGSHGYDVHPQTFVRLVGCRQPDAGNYDAAQPRQRTAA
jgi:hypothetical protein